MTRPSPFGSSWCGGRPFAKPVNLYGGMEEKFMLEEWDETHPRWREFVSCLETVAPEQAPFVLGEHYRAYRSYSFVALRSDEVVGFLRFAVQPIGPEAKCPPLYADGAQLSEAKIHAFAVREDARGRGIGTELQKLAIRRARELGCYQVASYSSYGRDANHRVKLSLGFGAQPEVHGDNEQGVYFIMPLRAKVV
jgi:GNAT superfamily N-acetyltransferase